MARQAVDALAEVRHQLDLAKIVSRGVLEHQAELDAIPLTPNARPPERVYELCSLIDRALPRLDERLAKVIAVTQVETDALQGLLGQLERDGAGAAQH
ncbi:MAG TPA: hypothetical protein PLR89_02550 [Ottowia sp.]|nr:hypothetical protein [Ottowia sp.]